MTVTDFIYEILKKRGITKVELAKKLHVKPNNMQNKMSRDNFTSIELNEIADVLDLELIFKDKTDLLEYIINYPENAKFQPKRNDKKTTN